MFVLGLLVGPFVAVMAIWSMTRVAQIDVRMLNGGLALILILVLLLPAVSLELRLGLVMGAFLGMVLYSTPLTLGEPNTD